MKNFSNFCILPETSRSFASQVVEKLTSEQKEKYGINDKNKDNAISAIMFLVEEYLSDVSDEKQEEMLGNVDGFISDLDNYFTVEDINEDEFDEANEIYDSFIGYENRLRNPEDENAVPIDCGTFGFLEFDTDDESQENALRQEAVLESHSELVDYKKRTNAAGQILEIAFVLKKPHKLDGVSKKQRALDTIIKIQRTGDSDYSKWPEDYEITNGTEVRYIKRTVPKGKVTENFRPNPVTGNYKRRISAYDGREYVDEAFSIPDGWKLTGRNRYRYTDSTGNSKLIVVDPASHIDDSYYKGPTVAASIGNFNDTVGRMYFDKSHRIEITDGAKIFFIDSKEEIPKGFRRTENRTESNPLWNADGSLREDNLENVIRTWLGNAFTVQGLKNLISDFQKLEEMMKREWHDDNLTFITEEIRLFGKVPGGDSWVHGKPDLLVVDSNGVVHVVDFKTYKMHDIKGYQTFDETKSERYGKQISRYIALLESYGLKVDKEAYVVQIDTWYDASDVVMNYDEEGNLKSGAEKIYNIDKQNGVTVSDYNPETNTNEEISLGTYAERHPSDREEILLHGGAEKRILYMEPRLHLGVKENGEGKIGFSEELAALRDHKDILFDGDITYEKQWKALSEDEKAELRWLSGIPAEIVLTKGRTRLSERHINSRPDIIQPGEVQDVANFIMYKVSRTISELASGKEIPYFPLSGKALRGMERYRIINTVGLDNLINYAFKIVENKYHDNFPILSKEEYMEDEEDWNTVFGSYEGYLKEKKWNIKADWLIRHKEQLIIAGNNKLMALEKCIVPRKINSSDSSLPSVRLEAVDPGFQEDSGDNEAINSYLERYIDGIASVEAWTLEARCRSNKASLAKEILRVFESIDQKDDKGNPIPDPYGWGFVMPLDATKAIQAVLDATKNCETMKDMEDALTNMASNPQNNWVNDVLSKLDGAENDSFKKKFFRHFRKDALVYSISSVRFDKKTGQRVIETRIVNMKSAYDVMTQALGAAFRNGKVGNISIEGKVYSLVSDGRLTTLEGTTIANKLMRKDGYIDEIDKFLESIYTDPEVTSFRGRKEQALKREKVIEKYKTKKFRASWSGANITAIEAITDVLHAIGLNVNQEDVANYLFSKVVQTETNNARTLLKQVKKLLTILTDQATKEGIPAGLANNHAGREYFPLCQKLANSVQEYMEASVYQDGKTYFSYTNPSRIGHIVRNLKNSLDDPSKFKKYIQENFGRYTGWYKTTDGSKWLCDWVKQFDTDEEARAALGHKVELSYIGNQYKNLGSLGFQLSILTNYFGSKNDESTGSGNYRWFALPTMSNKPTNEFIRMLKYKGPEYKSTIIRDVLMPTFHQEMNRIADVLGHWYSGKRPVDNMDIVNKKLIADYGWTQQEIDELKGRIETHTLTAEDVKKLSKVKSGAKFHFLWYLNEEMDKNPELAERIANKLNVLLTDPDEQNIDTKYEKETLDLVKETIASKMEDIVNAELDEMEKIGLFDTETKKNADGKGSHKILKYQEQFGGKLGQYRMFDEKGHRLTPEESFDIAKKEMREALIEFVWQDIAANINIIQITGGDLAYYGDAVNYQKRIAQIHSPGLKMMLDPAVTDGYLRSVHISDEMVRDEIRTNTEVILTDYMNNSDMTKDQKEDYRKVVSAISSKLKKMDTESTDGQSYDSPSSIKKKLSMEGDWNDILEEAYNRIKAGDFSINNLAVFIQPRKPFVTSDMAKYSGSTTMDIRRVPLQDKNSEYLILLAEALARGAGKNSKLVAICDFMEATHKMGTTNENKGKIGIDTVHFASVNKVGKSGVIDIGYFDEHYDSIYEDALNNNAELITDKDSGKILSKDAAYNRLLTEYLLKHVRRADSKRESLQSRTVLEAENNLVNKGVLKPNEVIYNNDFVDTIPVDDYITQQEVPAHLLQEHGQLYGSQIRILGISDITPGSQFTVGEETLTDEQLIDEYKNLHAANIKDSFNLLLEDLGIIDVESLREKMLKENKVLTKEEFIEDRNLKYNTEREKADTNAMYSMYLEENTFKTIVDMPVGTKERNIFFTNLESILQNELSKDEKYGLDMRDACSLERDGNGNVIDFTVPLMDPIQSKRIQMLINSIIKKTINKQKINGGPVVQTTAYDKNLHIRFKDGEGNMLKTYTEFKEEYDKQWLKDNDQESLPKNSKWNEDWKEHVREEFRKYLEGKNASIAYFECYMPIPNAELERLLTNEDGSMMSFEEARKKVSPKVWKSLTEVIGYRIPTEDKYSMIPLKIVGFVPRAAGQVIMMPQEITFLTGSDFDIDKMYIMMKTFDINTNDNLNDKEMEYVLDFITNAYINSGHKPFADMKRVVRQVFINACHIMRGDSNYNWHTGISSAGTKVDLNMDAANAFIEWYRDFLLETGFTELSLNTTYKNPKDRRNARNNRILDLQWAVLTHPDTAAKMLNPGNFDEIKHIGGVLEAYENGAINPETKKEYTWEELSKMDKNQLDSLIENKNPHNTTLPSSKIYFQRQNMQGTQMVGIFANHNVSHAFCSFQKIGICLNKDYRQDNTFFLDGRHIGDRNNPTILDSQRGFNGQLISKTIASCLAASVDTAKDPTMAKLNINTFTGNVATLLVRMGYDLELVGLILRQPIVREITDLYFKKSTDGYYDGNTAIEEIAANYNISKNDLQDTEGIRDPSVLTRENLIGHLKDGKIKNNDFQKRVLSLFYRMYQMSKDLQELTFCTKFNSISNAVGPTIADTMEDALRVRNFFDTIEDTCFYEPVSDSDEFTDVRDVIYNDPILNAFYSTTIGPEGASERIFKNFFPHYYEGFQNTLNYFKDHYTRKGKISSKLYNQLLDEYIYFMLTYRDDSLQLYPTLPYTTGQKDKLIGKLVSDFREVQGLKNRRPNMLLDENLGANCLRVREADEFLAKDILIFNGSQLNAEAQQKVKNAWSDLITYEDAEHPEVEKKVRDFAINLFFYTLMRNGFGFSPRTLMHLSSVIVRYNARYNNQFNYYINGLRGLKNLDYHLTSGTDGSSMEMIRRFCNQFARNHANNRRLVPNLSIEDTLIISENIEKQSDGSRVVTEIEIGVTKDKEHDLNRVLLRKGVPCQFITVTKKEGKTLTQELYELDEKPGINPMVENGSGISITYRRSNKLGLTNNFIEYDANSNIKVSYFEGIRNESEESIQDEDPMRDYGRNDEQEDVDAFDNSEWLNINKTLKTFEGSLSKKGAEGNLRRAALRDIASRPENSRLRNALRSLLDTTVDRSEHQETVKGIEEETREKIDKRIEEQNKCGSKK